MGAAALATMLFFRGFLPGPSLRPGGPGEGVDGRPGEETAAAVVVYAQFALEAPGAASVAVAGDFDEWEGEHRLTDLDGDGIWTGRVPVSPGVHAYMFLVDDATWMTDPRAERYAEDGFGNRNAVLAVAAPET
jgi:1,4-alpha-glucan branching enzyme